MNYFYDHSSDLMACFLVAMLSVFSECNPTICPIIVMKNHFTYMAYQHNILIEVSS